MNLVVHSATGVCIHLLFFVQLVVCLDDLNMASPDAYGSQPCTELLRQLSDVRGWYDRKNLTWKVGRTKPASV